MNSFFKNFMSKEEKEKLLSEEANLRYTCDSLKHQKSILNNEIAQLTIEEKNINERIKNMKNYIIQTEIKYFDNLNGLEFEEYTKNLLIKLGYIKVEVTKSTNDFGVDVIAEKDNIKYGIQCKNYSDKVGNSAVQEVHAGITHYHCTKGMIITNNYFTSQAINQAQELDIILIDRDLLIKLICDANNFDMNDCYFFANRTFFNKNIKIDSSYLNNEDEEEADEYLIEAIDMAVDIGQISASGLQRRFKIGYTRAGKIIDQMESRGLISGYEGASPRKVLISKERWNELKASSMDSMINNSNI